MSVNVKAVILSGGQSRRMGRDKSLVLWQGVPLLRRVYDVAAAVVGEVSIMTPWGDRYQEILPPGYHWFADEQPGEGPLVALQQVLRESNPAEVDWIWLLGCDLPSLNPEILQRWLENLENSTPEDLVAVARSPQGWEPLCGFYRPQVLPQLQNFIAQGGRSFQNWLDQVPHVQIPLGKAEEEMLYNCNSLFPSP
ncbi:molybdenum cofactor guanylyltransferase [Phormidium yuhuli AB48]|uniref:Probable molybdenum cofactor guanylyltransferase n=1 Tax=Phormidium yuhuli AB48 TaxID=2940671 RepID=A0ABY5AQB5_9CYAN|nr:molybdenum cofactor guanylyltransferase [Phormidium yuhuli]USR91000.1 molybdenum cofactor guanylyltransferase [Phormidium yuhuli AB48]